MNKRQRKKRHKQAVQTFNSMVDTVNRFAGLVMGKLKENPKQFREVIKASDLDLDAKAKWVALTYLYENNQNNSIN